VRIGIGYDVHPLAEGRPLILGGVTVPHPRGLLGHSDGDVLAHAVMDALLGAAGLGDIGLHFPPEDPQYEGISSLLLLSRVRQFLEDQGYAIGNIDATILAEEPRLGPFIPKMRRLLGRMLGMEEDRVGVKATPQEGLGFVGRGEGIAAYAVALIEKTEG